jgi:hypothetical protein
MDELFLLPPAPVAMPRAYWMDKFFLSSQLIVIEPSEREWNRVEKAMNDHKEKDYDMDILNNLYGASSTVIPHRPYDLLTGEFAKTPSDSGDDAPHDKYLGSSDEKWQARDVMKEAKFIHFSDWPMPKPWLETSNDLLEKHQPKCSNTTGELDCSNRDVWLELRRNFSRRREVFTLHECGPSIC